MDWIKRVLWAVVPGLALLVACSGPGSRGPAGPSTTGGSEWGEIGATLGASDLSCTLTQGYWKNHPEAWPVPELVIGGVSYTVEEALAILSTPPARGNATYILAHQLIAAKLNVLGGADDSSIADIIVAADAWLAANPPGSVTVSDPDVAIALAETLDEYNNGDIGPGACEDAPTPEPTPTPPPSAF